MMPRTLKKQPEKKLQDDSTLQIYSALKSAFPNLSAQQEQVVYRYNPVSIRVRVVSPRFTGKSLAEREEMVLEVLDSVPSEMAEDITYLLMLSPREARRPDLMSREFDDPNTYL